MRTHHTALLFDIDGTLLDTKGAGGAALREAVAIITDCSIDGIALPELAGATDSAVFPAMLESQGVEPSPEVLNSTYDTYFPLLEKNLSQESNFTPTLLPGVTTLIQKLALREDIHLGLLTGNAKKGAEIKLHRFGLDQYFSKDIAAFGNEHPDRGELAKLAASRAQKASPKLPLEQIWVIGDTPKDIACAQFAGISCAAVATGGFSEEHLSQCGADLVVTDLTDPRLSPLFFSSTCESAKSA